MNQTLLKYRSTVMPKLGIALIFFSFIIVLFTIWLESRATTSYLATLSCILLILISCFIFFYSRKELFSPLVVFSTMYSGYSIGGFYYSQSNGYFGKFLGFMDFDRGEIESLMIVGMVYAILCYIFFVAGYVLFRNKLGLVFNFSYKTTPFYNFFQKYYMYVVIPLLGLGLVYWYWIAITVSGSVLNLVLYFQAFRHLIADSDVTTLPYHFYYAGIFLWLLGLMCKHNRVNFCFLFFSVLGMVIILTQGQIFSAITFMLSQILFVALFDYRKTKKMAFLAVSLVSASFVIYFLRIASNFLFLGREFDISQYNFLDTIVGGGNVADLQQLVIIFNTFNTGNVLLGATYLDWLRNSLGGMFGLAPSSVGLVIKELYVPASSGAPTPGAIGEAYANFIVFAPLVMFYVGALLSIIHSKALKSRSPILLFMYSVFLANFVFLYPKVDSTMLVNFLWGVTPPLLVLLTLYFVFSVTKLSKAIKVKGI